jgi:hypothetical protein
MDMTRSRVLAKVCRALNFNRALLNGDVAKIVTLRKTRHLMSPWRSVQFKVGDYGHFVFIVQLTGRWSTKDTFRLGVATATLPLDGADGHVYGFWLSPKSGRFIHTYIHTYIQTHLHTYNTYIHTYIHTYIITEDQRIAQEQAASLSPTQVDHAQHEAVDEEEQEAEQGAI